MGLARELGIPTVRGLLDQMTSADITEAMAYDKILADRRAGAPPTPTTAPDPAEVTRRTFAYFSRRASRPPASM